MTVSLNDMPKADFCFISANFHGQFVYTTLSSFFSLYAPFI